MLNSLRESVTRPGIAAVALLTRNPDGSLFSAGGTISWISGLARQLRVPRTQTGPYAVDWVEGPCLLVSLTAVAAIGEFDEEFLAYWEDVDWCVRAVNLGWRCLVDPRTGIVHARGSTIPSTWAEAMDLRNGLLFMRRNGSVLSNISAALFFLTIRAPLFLVRRSCGRSRLRDAIVAIRNAIAWNLSTPERTVRGDVDVAWKPGGAVWTRDCRQGSLRGRGFTARGVRDDLGRANGRTHRLRLLRCIGSGYSARRTANKLRPVLARGTAHRKSR